MLSGIQQMIGVCSSSECDRDSSHPDLYTQYACVTALLKNALMSAVEVPANRHSHKVSMKLADEIMRVSISEVNLDPMNP